MNTDPKPAARETKSASASKARRAQAKKLRPANDAEKLVCRYCGSNDLAPSFRKRCDARCRACFKKRYASSARGKKVSRTRTMKVAK